MSREYRNLTNEQNFDGIKATVYRTSDFMGEVVKMEVKLFKTFKAAYAQYDSIDYYHCIVKNKRTKYEFHTDGYKPFLLIVKGWNRPEPTEDIKELYSNENATVSQYKYRSFDERYISDFLASIDGVFSEEDIIVKIYFYKDFI